jgi:hypothetical protein
MAALRAHLITRLAILSLGVACLLVGQAWYRALREWLAVAMGQVDLEYVGSSLLIVPLVAVGAIGAVGILDLLDRPAAGAAVGMISAVVLLLAIVDNVVGALADGDISSLGWRIGLLSGAMAGAVVAVTAIVAWRAWSGRSRHLPGVRTDRGTTQT